MTEEVMRNRLAKPPYAVLEAFIRDYRQCGDFSQAATEAHGANWGTTDYCEDKRFADNVVKCCELVFNGGALPIDEEGIPIRPGDVLVEHEDGHTFVVDGYEYDRVSKKWWVFENNAIQASAVNCTHKAETIEDIIDEIQEKYIVGGASLEEYAGEYAGRIMEAARREEACEQRNRERGRYE